MQVKIKHKKPSALKELIAKVDKMPQIALGFPRGKATAAQYPDGTSVLNVAFWNNYGTFDKNGNPHIPARRFMDTGGRRASIELKPLIAKLLKSVNEGKMTSEDAAEIIGLKATAILKKEITEMNEPPNAPETIRKKKSSNPLIDTGLMRQTVTFELRDKRK